MMFLLCTYVHSHVQTAKKHEVKAISVGPCLELYDISKHVQLFLKLACKS